MRSRRHCTHFQVLSHTDVRHCSSSSSSIEGRGRSTERYVSVHTMCRTSTTRGFASVVVPSARASRADDDDLMPVQIAREDTRDAVSTSPFCLSSGVDLHFSSFGSRRRTSGDTPRDKRQETHQAAEQILVSITWLRTVDLTQTSAESCLADTHASAQVNKRMNKRVGAADVSMLSPAAHRSARSAE